MRLTRKRLSSAAIAVILEVLSAPSTGRAYSLTSYSWNEPVTLKLTDGRSIEGRYRGVFGRTSDPGHYAERYAKWRANAAAPALGETLVVSRASGEPVRGRLHGFADHAILLGTEDSCRLLILPLDKLTDVQRTNDDGTEAASVETLRRWRSAPSLYTVALEDEAGAFAVPVTSVASREMLPRAGGNTTATVVTGVLVAAVLLAGAAAAAMASAFAHPMI